MKYSLNKKIFIKEIMITIKLLLILAFLSIKKEKHHNKYVFLTKKIYYIIITINSTHSYQSYKQYHHVQ